MDSEPRPLRATVIGSYPFPSWLAFASRHLEAFGTDEIVEMQTDAVICAIHDQTAAGLDVISDGEQTRLDFNLSFYGYLEGLGPPEPARRHFGPPAHDQRGKHPIAGPLGAPRGLGVVAEFERLQRLAPEGYTLKASIPGPYTLSGRLLPNPQYPDRMAITEALVPIVRQELVALVAAGCREITVDEPSMSCYAYRSDTTAFVEIFNRTVAPVVGECFLSTHLCFGNYKGRAVGKRAYGPMFPDFLEMQVDEFHLEMASREFADLELIADIAKRKRVAVGIVDVESYYIEPPEEIAERVRRCLAYAPPERLSFAPDCGLSQTARWAARQKLANMVAGIEQVRADLEMKNPLLQDESFLADVAAARSQPEALHIWWLGQSGFLVGHGGAFLLFDPYLSDSLTAKYAGTAKPHVRMTERVIAPDQLEFVDVVTSTHNHTDHLDAATLRPLLAANPDLTLLVPAANLAFAADRLQLLPERLAPMTVGQPLPHPPFTFHAVPAAHEALAQDDSGHYRHLGYVVEVGSWTIYHSGDTVRYPGMAEHLLPWDLDVALLPINGRDPARGVAGNLSGEEAVELAQDANIGLVIPCHFDMFAFNTVSPAGFVAAAETAGQPFRLLQNGERLTLAP